MAMALCGLPPATRAGGSLIPNENSLFRRISSLFRRKTSLFGCIGNLIKKQGIEWGE
jgi:hypothetical protein